MTTVEPSPVPPPALASLPVAEAEVVDLLRDLIRIDTTNTGDDSGPGEALAAEYVEASLREVGYDPERFETTSGRRQGVVLRIPGRSPGRGALLLHGHLDVVPAIAADWSVAPFEAEIRDDLGEPMIWGRGAVDMKDMDAMMLATVRAWARDGVRPDRDVVVMFLPDEEAGGWSGSHFLVRDRLDMFEGVTEAVGEVGGFSMTVRDDLRMYLIQTAERGIAWMKLRAHGTASHGSLPNEDNAVTALCEAVARVGAHRFPVQLTPTVERFLHELAEVSGVEVDMNDLPTTLSQLGTAARYLGATLVNTLNPTMLDAGYKINVVPGEASAQVDGRFLPGTEEEFFAEVDRLLGDGITREFISHDVAVETTFDGPTIDAMAAALRSEDPGAHPVPYMLFGGTDAKAFSLLGIRCFGFAPLLLPPALDFGGLFHGVDERVPVSSIRFGVRVLDRFLRSA